MNKMKGIVLALGVASAAQSAIIASYCFENAGTATTADSNLSAGALSSPMAIVFNSTVGDDTGLDADGVTITSPTLLGAVAVDQSQTPTQSFGEAVTGNDYLSFTITPLAGYSASLTSISFKAAKYAADRGADNFAVANGSGAMIGDAAVITWTSSVGTYQGVTIDLSGAVYQNIQAETELRIYAWVTELGNDSTSYDCSSVFVDNVVLNGSVEAIPEPATISLFGLTAIGILINRRLKS